MNPSTIFSRALAALAQPRLGMAFVTSCVITAGVAGPMAYQATHFHPIEQSASGFNDQVVAPQPPHRAPATPTRPEIASPASTLRPTTTTTTRPKATAPTTTGTPATRRATPPAAATTTSSDTPTTIVPVTASNSGSQVHTQISPAGSLVASRRGAVAIQVTSTGGPLAQAHLTITATGATASTEPNDGWVCSGTGTVDCDDQNTLVPAAAGAETVFVALDVASGASAVTITAVATAPGAAPSSDAATTDRAPVTTGFSARFAGVIRGDVTTVGNTLSTCPSGATAGGSTCEQARARATGVTVGQDNNDWNMVAVDADNDPATANSSAANLTVGSSDVLSATLYWSGATTAGAGGTAASGSTQNALFATPSTTGGAPATVATYVPVSASQTDQVGSTYQSSADVTALVRAGGNGQYWLGGISAATGANTQSGWTLTVVYRQAGAAPRTVLIFDGLVQVAGGTQILTASGFRVSPSTSAQLGLVAYEGDWGLRTDSVTCGPSAPLSDATRDPDNFFNSSITDGGAIDASRTPAQPNTFGLDVARVDVSPATVAGCLTPGSSSTTLQFSTADDQYLVGVVTLSATR